MKILGILTLVFLYIGLIRAYVNISLQIVVEQNTFVVDIPTNIDIEISNLQLNIKQVCEQIFPSDSTLCQSMLFERYVEEYKSHYFSLENINSHFTADLSKAYCNLANALSTYSSSIDKCLSDVTDDIRSIKAMRFYETIPKMFDFIDSNEIIVVHKNWKMGIEGSIMQYHDKIVALQEIADNSNIQNICEIGFNLGHSVSSRITLISSDISNL
jgi:hypothetical protein